MDRDTLSALIDHVAGRVAAGERTFELYTLIAELRAVIALELRDVGRASRVTTVAASVLVADLGGRRNAVVRYVAQRTPPLNAAQAAAELRAIAAELRTGARDAHATAPR
jgi:hypothetical protein